MKLFILACSILLSCSLKGQVQVSEVQFFSDTLGGNLDYVFQTEKVSDGIIISGKEIIGSIEQPVILKVNLNGEVVWSTLTSLQIGTTDDCVKFSFMISDDGFIYGASQKTHPGFSTDNTYWKVNATTGLVMWTKNHSNVTPGYIVYQDYSDSTFLIAFKKSQYVLTLAIMSKVNGDTLVSRIIADDYYNYDYELDENKNIFFSYGYQVRKYNLNNLDELIWEHAFRQGSFPIGEVHRIYIDDFDDLYVFGREGNIGSGMPPGRGIIAKANAQNGLAVWQKVLSDDGVQITDWEDFQGKIIASYKHAATGSWDPFRTGKIDKETGIVDWNTLNYMTPVGTIGNNNGETQSIFSMDVDCNGDAYVSGFYYGQFNGGAWGNMKISYANGLKIYDNTITYDSVTFDDRSFGVGVHLFGNSPVIIGNLEAGDQSYALEGGYYLTMNPATGALIQFRRLNSKVHYQQASATLDIVTKNGKTFVLKQVGGKVVVECYSNPTTFLWRKTLSDNSLLHGGQMTVSGTYVFVTAARAVPDTVTPYFTSTNDKLVLYRITISNQALLTANFITAGSVKPIELEADDTKAFVFYRDNGNLEYRSWTTAGFSAAQILETAGSNTDYFGNLNTVLNDNSTRLLAAGQDALYSINKTDLSKTAILNYAGPRQLYDTYLLNDTLYLSGANASGQQIVTAFQRLTNTLQWDQTYQTGGTIHKMTADITEKLYLGGTKNNAVNIKRISSLNGSVDWEYINPVQIDTITSLADIEINQTNGFVAVTGRKTLLSGASDGYVTLVEQHNGTFLGDTMFQDQQVANSFGQALQILSNNDIWVGGALNRISYSKEGFIQKINYGSPTCFSALLPGLTYTTATNLCPDASFTLSLEHLFVNQTYQWQVSSDGINWTSIPAATSQALTTTQAQSSYYRCAVSCGGNTAWSTPVQVSSILPQYTTLPYFESFESWTSSCGATTNIPSAYWVSIPKSGNNSFRRNDQGSSAGWTGVQGAHTPASTHGSFSARFHSRSAPVGTSGSLDLYVNCNSGGLQKTITFDYQNIIGGDSFNVLVSTDGGQTFTSVGTTITNTSSAGTGWEPKTITFSSLSPTTVIRFRATSNDPNIYNDITIDNLNIVATPSNCPDPISLAISNITETSADASWNFTSAPANGYEYVISTSSTQPVSGGTDNVSTSVGLSSLIPGTTYYFFVRCDCGTGLSNWISTSFTTTPANVCNDPVSLAISVITQNSATASWNFASSTPANGYEYVISTSATQPASNGTDNASTSFGLSSLTPETTYYFFVRSDCGNGLFSNWVSTSFTTPAPVCDDPVSLAISGVTENSANASWNFASSAPANGYEYVISTSSTQPSSNGTDNASTSVSLSLLTPSTTYYFFVRSDCGNGFSNWVFTNFTTPVAGCDAPISLTISNITENSADASWNFTSSAPANAYEYVISTSSSQPSSNGTDNASTSVSLSSLSAGTTYYFFVRSDCGNGFSIWTSTSFTTPSIVCDDPISLAISTITENSANALWNFASSAPANGYEYVISTSSALPSSNGTDNASISVSLSSLAPSTTYYFFVRSDCGNGFSNWVSVSFSTTETTNNLVENQLSIESILLHPNPASHYITVSSINSNVKIESLAVYAPSGEFICDNKNTLNKETLFLKNLSNGLYMVVIQTDSGNVIKRFTLVNED